MTLRHQISSQLIISLALVALCFATPALAADQLVPEVTMPPPTADLPGTPPPPPAASTSTGSVPTGSAAMSPPPAPTLSKPQSATPQVPITATEDEPQPAPTPTENAEQPGPKPTDNVVVPVKQDEPDWPNINKKKWLGNHGHWGVQFDVSPGALGRNIGIQGVADDNATTESSTPWGFSMAMEYQPEWAQKFGILSFGPSLNLYPVIPTNDDVPNAESIWSIGFQLRYQFHYSEQQFLVPVVGFNYEKLTYHLVSEGNGSFPISGPTLGLNVLLNDLDPKNATAFYFDAGVLKTYLVVEARFMSGSDANLQVSGLSWFFGVRMEF